MYIGIYLQNERQRQSHNANAKTKIPAPNNPGTFNDSAPALDVAIAEVPLTVSTVDSVVVIVTVLELLLAALVVTATALIGDDVK